MFWNWSTEDVVQFAAYMVGGTDVAVFRLPDMTLLEHIRNDDSDAAQRSAAIGAFKELIELANGKDGVIEINVDAEGPTPSRVLQYAGYRAQYCLIVRPAGGLIANMVVAVIARCANEPDAARRMEHMQGILRLW
jgi:hypothetical protein